MSASIKVAPLFNSTNTAAKESTTSTKTIIPSNLEELPKDELIRIVKRLRDEVEEANNTNKKQKMSSAAVLASLKSPTSATAVASAMQTQSFDVKAVKKRITQTVNRMVKKTAHKNNNKPWTEINESISTINNCMELLKGYTPISDTKKMIKWDLKGTQVNIWLQTKSMFIHPVKYDGHVWCLGGGPKPKIYGWAAFDSCQVKYDKKSGNLTLKFRTYLAGTGKNDGLDRPLYMND